MSVILRNGQLELKVFTKDGKLRTSVYSETVLSPSQRNVLVIDSIPGLSLFRTKVLACLQEFLLEENEI